MIMGKQFIGRKIRRDMATGWVPDELTDWEIYDGESYHRALYRDGDLRSPVSWHKHSVEELVDLALPHINDGSIVVDYGTGTGGSAIELLKKTDSRGISIELILIDPLRSWFGKAREILGERDDVHFELSVEEKGSGGFSFKGMQEMMGGRKADVILSSSTLHLVPMKAIDDLVKQFAGSLSPTGVVVWNSGDLECGFRPLDAARLHDPYRIVRNILREDEARMRMMAELSKSHGNSTEKRLDRIFPIPFPIEVIFEAFSGAGFSNEISERIVHFSNEDAENFILVPRLAEIAAPLMEGDERDTAIKKSLEIALSNIKNQGLGSDTGYRSHWVYGLHKQEN